MDKEVLHKEIDLIQSCISRMASNSFLIKGWTISLIGVVLALIDKQSLASVILLLILPVLSFWFLDAYFLRTERQYRELYKWVLDKRNLNSCEYLYDLNPDRFSDRVSNIFKTMFSLTLGLFYGFQIFCIILFTLFISKGS
ncbi:MAG: hypothetical protein KGO93_07860 [Cyanobacteria bacterium REEB446]|nr:hypothetical protein [Cyanobacteria bacterium REEB446]